MFDRTSAILKIIGASFVLVSGTACEAIGIPLMCVRNSKYNEAKEVYSQSEEYLTKKTALGRKTRAI